MDIVTKVKPEERGLIYEYHRSLVEEYLRIGCYRKVADKSDVNVMTVIKWVRCHRQNGLRGLKDRSRRPRLLARLEGSIYNPCITMSVDIPDCLWRLWWFACRSVILQKRCFPPQVANQSA